MTAQETSVILEESEVRRVRRRKPRGRLRAILAAMGVLGIGAAVTLAAWTDTEWIFGGTDNGPGVGTSSVNIQQNVNDAAGWRDGQTEGTAGKLNFPVAATALSPGTTAQTTLQALLTALPTAVSAQVNVQADVASPAPRPVTTLDAGELGVTALRIGSLPAGRTAWLAFGSSAAGPNAYLPAS